MRWRDLLRLASTIAAVLLAAGLFCAPQARADDKLKVAIGQINNWDNQVPQIGQRAGIFRKHGIILETVATQGAGETLQAVISGVDIGIGVGTVGAMRAYSKGAPVRVIGAAFTGVGDIYWYVRADSPIKKIQDATNKNTIAYSTNGAASDYIVRAFANDLGVKAKPVATGSAAPTLVQVLAGHIDIGWASPPIGLEELQEGKIRIFARGSDVPAMREQTTRVQIVNAKTLETRKDVIARFMRAYREALEWLYSDPRALKYYSEATSKPESLLVATRQQFHPKQAMSPDRLSGLDSIMTQAVALKFLDKPLSKDQLADLIQIPPP